MANRSLGNTIGGRQYRRVLDTPGPKPVPLGPTQVIVVDVGETKDLDCVPNRRLVWWDMHVVGFTINRVSEVKGFRENGTFEVSENHVTPAIPVNYELCGRTDGVKSFVELINNTGESITVTIVQKNLSFPFA